MDYRVGMEMFDCTDDLEDDGLDLRKREGGSLGVEEVVEEVGEVGVAVIED